MLTTTVGLVAAFLTTASFVPQAIKVIRSPDVSGVSVAMYGMFAAGASLWLLYGLLVWSGPIIIANGITLALCVTILRGVLRRRK